MRGRQGAPPRDAACGEAAARVRQRMSTGVPIGTRRYRSMTSATCIRIQPCEPRVPIEPPGAVPWMPTPLTMPIQRALSGFAPLPPATDVPASSPAHGELGAVQTGLTCLLAIENSPRGVG